MAGKRLWSLAALGTAGLVLFVATSVCAAGAPRISSDELKARLGEPGLVILDARTPSDWGRATSKIVGARRVDPHRVESWAPDYDRRQTIVLYCA